MTQLNETTNRAEMQCSDVNPGAVQKCRTAPSSPRRETRELSVIRNAISSREQLRLQTTPKGGVHSNTSTDYSARVALIRSLGRAKPQIKINTPIMYLRAAVGPPMYVSIVRRNLERYCWAEKRSVLDRKKNGQYEERRERRGNIWAQDILTQHDLEYLHDKS